MDACIYFKGIFNYIFAIFFQNCCFQPRIVKRQNIPFLCVDLQVVSCAFLRKLGLKFISNPCVLINKKRSVLRESRFICQIHP